MLALSISDLKIFIVIALNHESVQQPILVGHRCLSGGYELFLESVNLGGSSEVACRFESVHFFKLDSL